MNGVMERTLAILQRLAREVGGVPIAALAADLDIPLSAAHRLLAELGELGYVRQTATRGAYELTTKLVSLGLVYLKNSGVVDLCQPVLDRLAESAGELVRLGVVDVDHLTWVALSQGARSGLRYDPDMGIDAQLSCTASGQAWLSTLPEDDAIGLVLRQGLGSPDRFGPHAPAGVGAVAKALRLAKRQGWAIARDSYAPGLSAIAAPIRHVASGGNDAVGVIAISGPSARLTDAKLRSLADPLLAAAADIAAASAASPLFDRAYRRLAADERHAPATESAAALVHVPAHRPAPAPARASAHATRPHAHGQAQAQAQSNAQSNAQSKAKAKVAPPTAASSPLITPPTVRRPRASSPERR